MADPCTCLQCRMRALLPGGSTPTEAETLETIAAMIPLFADRLALCNDATTVGTLQKIADIRFAFIAAAVAQRQRSDLACMEVAGRG